MIHRYSAILLFLLFILFPVAVGAHPQDQIYWDISIISQKVAKTSMHLSWQEASYIIETFGTPQEALALTESGKGVDAFKQHIDTMYALDQVYISYILKHISMKNNGDVCRIALTSPDAIDYEEALIGRGIRIEGTIVCDAPFNTLEVSGDVLLEDFPYQTTIVTVTTGLGETMENVLKKTHSSWIIDIKMPQSAYPSAEKPETTPETFTGLLLFAFSLGFLHTLEAGHSKSILAGLAIDPSVSFLKLLSFIGIFIVTHILDIVVLAVVFLSIGSVVDIYAYLPKIQTLTAYLITGIGFLMLYRSYRHIHTHHHEEKRIYLLGFVSGLAPCLAGWSLLFMVLGKYPLSLIFPVIASFAGGIAVMLLIVSIVVYKSRTLAVSRFHAVSHIAPKLSAVFVLLYGVFSIFRIYLP